MQDFLREYGQTLGLGVTLLGFLWQKFRAMDAHHREDIRGILTLIDTKFDKIEGKFDKIFHQIQDMNNRHNVLNSKVYGLQAGIERDRVHYDIPPYKKNEK